MKPGSVIVDLAGESGGNCELTEPGETVVKHDVKIVAPLNLPALMPEHASQLFARNVLALLELLVGEDGALNLDFDDEIVAGACIVRDGEIVHPGPRPRWRRPGMILASTLTTNLAILVLAGFIGFVVISKVPNTLHTPLMSGTNAIHGIVLLGGLLLLGLAGSGRFQQGAARDRGGVRHDQHRRRVPRHRSHARDVQVQAQAAAAKDGEGAGTGGGAPAANRLRADRGEDGKGSPHDRPLPLASSFLQSESFIYVLYIVAFALFIQGLRGLAGPTTAVRGNRTAAVGMAIAVVATLLNPGEGNWGLIALGIALGVAVGVPAARQVKMTAMPQMVALFNGVGGGAVALISWVEFRHHGSTYGSHTINVAHEFGRVASCCRPAPSSRSAGCPRMSRSSRCSPRSSARSRSGARTSRSASSRKSSLGGRSPSAPPSRSSTSCC